MVAMPHWPLYLGADKDLSISPERALVILKKLGDPHLKLKGVYHVTGTNGKGSTSCFIKQILVEGGSSVNFYTSPHLIECNERIVIKGEVISDNYLYELIERVRFASEELGVMPTIFEATTIAAFLAYAENEADYAVIEVGMGGRLDCTNVFPSENVLATVFTPIDLDHVKVLGATREEIALQKSYIMRAGVAAVSSLQTKGVRDVLKRQADLFECPFIMAGEHYAFEKVEGDEDEDGVVGMAFSMMNERVLLPLPSMRGDHQVANSCCAIAAVMASIGVDFDVVARALKTCFWGGRLESVKSDRLKNLLSDGSEIVFDGAHNPAGARVLAKWISEVRKEWGRDAFICVLVGKSKGADNSGFFREFIGSAVDEFMVVTGRGEAKPENASVLSGIAASVGLKARVAECIFDGIKEAGVLSGGRRCCFVVCGSLYLMKDVKEAGRGVGS